MTDVVNVGTTDNDGNGDTLRAAFSQINTRFNELLSTIDGGDAWATGVTYTATPIRQWVVESGQAYVAAVNHVSGASFAADLAAGKWFAVDSAQILADLAAPTGASLIGYTPTGLLTATTVEGALNEVRDASKVSYTPAGTGAVATTLQKAQQEFKTLFDFMTLAQVADIKANTASIDVTAAIQAAINYGGIISVKAGTYLHGSLNFVGKSVCFIGDGEDKTIFKASGAVTMFDVLETSDQALLPLAFIGIQLNGNSVATAGIKTRYRHKTLFQNVTVKNINGDALNELDSWNNLRSNLTLNNNVNGLVLQGANNNTKYTAVSASGNTQYQLKIENGGTVAGGSTALSFYNCDFEYAPGFGVYVNTTGVVRFNDCYIGEQIDGTVFDMAAGEVIVSGGVVQYGKNLTSYLGNLGGGKLLFKGVKIEGGINATVSNMFVSGNGRASIEDSPAYIITANAQVMAGDCLDYGKAYDCFASKLGRQYTGFCLNGTFTSSTTANELTVTCASVTGSPCLLEAHANVTRNWIDGQPGSLIITYKSSQPCSVRLTQSPVGNTPAINIDGTLPATATVKTAVFYNWTYTAGIEPLILEIFQNTTILGDYLTVYEVFLSDSKNTKVDAVATFYNMAKC